MKIVITLFFLTFNICVAQETYEAKKIINFENILFNEGGNDIYKLDLGELRTLISISDKDYHLIYTFGYWCKPCVENLTDILEFTVNSKSLNLYILNIENSEERMFKTKEILKNKFNFENNSFTIKDIYGRTRWKKYHAFVEELFPGHRDYGMSLFILLDKKGKVLYGSTFNQSYDFKYKKIKSIIYSEK